MAERKTLTARRKPGTGRKDLDKALKEVSGGDEPKKRIPLEVPVATHRKLSSMRAHSQDNVPVREFLLEAIDDLFEKYRRGEGRFAVDDIERILGE
ncbi:hypothetical protein [Halomonas getboli]|uniref:hypothetical protein n=1 Tax=Halomonas getboli TaxID=2935862 RepID=UPI001FFF7C2E|nr:hypothetical protein [Halomonas getboli]MCK2185709.1 hypothetical protein [Halomonas getboli]